MDKKNIYGTNRFTKRKQKIE
ncbi:hypothetical protein C802_00392, partial [Phocaeicola sartorii]